MWPVVPGYSDTASLFFAISRAVVNHEDGNGTAPDPGHARLRPVRLRPIRIFRLTPMVDLGQFD